MSVALSKAFSDDGTATHPSAQQATRVMRRADGIQDADPNLNLFEFYSIAGSTQLVPIALATEIQDNITAARNDVVTDGTWAEVRVAENEITAIDSSGNPVTAMISFDFEVVVDDVQTGTDPNGDPVFERQPVAAKLKQQTVNWSFDKFEDLFSSPTE